MRGGKLDRFPSPLRYPGGKGKVANYMKLLFLRNNLVGYHYVEPYAGGASVALSLLYEAYATHIHINDLNRSVYAFWCAVLTDTEALCARIADTAVTLDEWERQKAVQAAAEPDPLDLAFSTFFLNRTNRSGIIDGGIIGGKNQTGAWKLDARFNRKDLTDRVKKVARHAGRITLTRCDAADYLRTVVPSLPANTFLYLDPPYFVKGQGLYQNAYAPEDHAEIAHEVIELERPWLVSYDAAPEIMDLYAGHTVLTYGLCYSAADRYRGSEAMFYSPGLVWPDVSTPANVRPKVVDSVRLAALST